MKKQPEYNLNKNYIVTLKFKFKGADMARVTQKIESRQEIKLTNLFTWTKELEYESTTEQTTTDKIK